jgi:hypothetical protein
MLTDRRRLGLLLIGRANVPDLLGRRRVALPRAVFGHVLA